MKNLPIETGLTYVEAGAATPGFTLFTPLGQKKTVLINMRGEVVHEWALPAPAGNYTYLLANGNLLAALRTEEGPQGLPAKGGLIREIDWDGNTVWEYVDHAQHHDFRRLANGNTAYLAWELMNKEAAARVRGGLAGTESKEGIWGDYIREVSPEGKTVWEWHAQTDQDIDKYPMCPVCGRAEFAHANTIFPTADGNYLISSRQNHLIARIDRATRRFSWEMMEKEFGHQHDVHELANGNVLLFANGDHTGSHGPHTGSRILEIDPKTKKTVWEYKTQPRHLFYSPHISGMQRLPSGNTLICEGLKGRIFEITPAGDIVWNFINPFF
ncbi:MAG: arylsulfotransferase family protein, partial [Burkholderiales bacterium]